MKKSLTSHARSLYRDRRVAAKWVLAMRYMRRRKLWVLDGAKVKWGTQGLSDER